MLVEIFFIQEPSMIVNIRGIVAATQLFIEGARATRATTTRHEPGNDAVSHELVGRLLVLVLERLSGLRWFGWEMASEHPD